MTSEDFESLYFEYSDKIYSYIFLYIKNKEITEDLTHDTFYKAFKNINSFKGNSTIYTWLIKIARNIVFDHFRRKKVLRFFSIEKHDSRKDEITPQEILIKGEEVKLLYEAINKLKLEYREIIILRKIKELSIKEISIILGWSETKIKNTTSRALAALRKNFPKGEEDFNEKFTEMGKTL
ncbi:RNA polymerase sigma factor [Heyndrickxia sporothermodurans]|uniref:RNA polymerase sigma factor n=1 Tax=Heyndrickxia sporothermodurans TaxID=46224 RepID=A0A150KUB8_9BACI|nr:RNA polymerase sigma factor [Heyndrickxia sporothermodurans]KYD03524.1 hypothetical protein B4102_3374 [Heyndrickxia sporothermodurans]MBL5783677.1 RNA polymerase sigma factor [Heyndrickxia sporothermodurans]MBL5794280.1 RNA polymerase sigma factor [Heyndrickxia sporothermodurans]MBL5805049.1 RNA polymerase sigma factor [Heyndrickxia sporothermodurans]MBL5808967.1 RNA polymerase sigma factor [Heyndrickxia sporothermodurans]